MKKIISSDLTLYNINFFPKTLKKKSKKRYNVVLGIGGNVGNVEFTFKKLFTMLRDDKRFSLLKTAPILKNPPFGYLSQDDFLNSVIQLKTDLSVNEFLKVILNIEKKLGRKRTFKNAPRAIDIDIIFFDNLKVNKKNLIVPHPYWKDRVSVTIPLSHILRNSSR
jgi:2-amino-4-hydroxy-6-hydroxymethyldihydropteridine diphosphokinase